MPKYREIIQQGSGAALDLAFNHGSGSNLKGKRIKLKKLIKLLGSYFIFTPSGSRFINNLSRNIGIIT